MSLISLRPSSDIKIAHLVCKLKDNNGKEYKSGCDVFPADSCSTKRSFT